MHWAEQWTRPSSSSCSPPAFGCQFRQLRGTTLDEIASSSSWLLSPPITLFEPLQKLASPEVASALPLRIVCTGEFQGRSAQHGSIPQKLQLVVSRSAPHSVGARGELEEKGFAFSNASLGLAHPSNLNGTGACRLKFEAPAQRKGRRKVRCRAGQSRIFAISVTALESHVAEAEIITEEPGAASVKSSSDDSALSPPGSHEEAASTTAKPKRKVRASRKKVSSGSTASQSSQTLPENDGSISPEGPDELKLAAVQVSPKVRVTRVYRKKVPVVSGKSRSRRSTSADQESELSSSEMIDTLSAIPQLQPISVAEGSTTTEQRNESAGILQTDTSLDSVSSSVADLEIHSSSDVEDEITENEAHLELQGPKDQGLLGVFLNTASTLSGYGSGDDGDKGADVADEMDSWPQPKLSTKLRQSSLDWVRNTSAAIPRNLPMKVSKWRRGIGANSPMMSAVVPKRSVTTQEIIQLLEGAKSFEDVAKTMTAYTGRVTSLEVKQILEDLGSKKDWLTASQLFDWLQDQPAYKPDESMYKTMINVLAKARRMDKVELIFECMEQDGLQPGLPEFCALIQGYLKSGAVYRAVTAFEEMRDEGMQPGVSLYNALLDGCARIPKGWETAVSLYETMKQDKVLPDRATFTSMLLLACRKGRYSSTIDFFKTMIESGFPPDKSIYHAVLNSYAKLGDTRMMLEVFEQLSNEKMEYDVMTYNVVLNALGRVGEIGKVSELYRRMRKAGVAADLQTCSILVTAWGKVQEWDEIDLVLEEMQSSGLQPDLTVYNSLISVYGKAGRLDAVEHIVAAMTSASDDQGSRISFDLITYNTLVDVYGKAGRLEDVKFWFSEMKKEGFPPDVKTFNALLNAYGKAGLFDGVREVLRLFREHGRKPDLTFYNTLLFTFGRAGKYEDAWQIVADMEQAGCFPGVEIFNSLMFVFGRGSQYQAMKVYDYMVDSGVEPNPTTFKLLIDIHGKRGMVDECLSLYSESLRTLGKQVNESLLSSVFGACCNMRRIEDAERLLEDLHPKHNVALACHNWLILGYGRKGLWRKSEQVLQESMSAKKLVPNGQTYSFLLEAYSLCGQFDKAAAIARKMLAENLLSGIGGYNSMLRYYIRSGRFQEALDLHDDLVDGQGPHPNHTSYAVLIECFGSDTDVNKRLIQALRDIDVDLSPKVVVYSALLEALRRCSRPGDAISIFDALKMFGFPVALGELLLLDDVGEEDLRWQRLAEEFQSLDKEGLNAEMQRGFHNAFVDALWVLGWEVRALRTVELSLERGIFGNVCTWDDGDWVLQLQLTSVGPAQVLLLTWIAQIQSEVQKGVRIADSIRIVLAAEWQVLIRDNLDARQTVIAQLRDLKAPFGNLHEDTCEFVASGTDFLEWLSQDRSGESLFLSNSAASDPQMDLLRKQALECFLK